MYVIIHYTIMYAMKQIYVAILCIIPATSLSAVSIAVAHITTSGVNIAGENYSLECSFTMTGSTEQPTITWLDPMDSEITSGVVTTGSMSILIFNPLAASHAGTYTCRATLGDASQSSILNITVDSEFNEYYDKSIVIFFVSRSVHCCQCYC